jgi:nucleoside-diphosphate-sugar epimerase
MKQRVLVLGAGGFIGSRIVQALAATQWATPIAGSRSGAACDDVAAMRVDATDTASLSAALSQVDAVVNCVAGSSDSIVANARALLQSLTSQSRAVRLVHLSSLAAYGSHIGDVDESAPLLGDLDDYSRAKAEAENILAPYPDRVVLRPGIVYGPGSVWWSDRIARLLIARRLGDLGASGDGICNLVYVEDVARAVVRALEHEAVCGEAFNLSLSNPPTWNRYFLEYAEALHATPMRRISAAQLAFELKIKAPMLKIVEIASQRGLLRGKHPAPPLRPWLTTLCQHEIRMTTSKAESQLGMQWLPLATGLQHSAQWFLGGGRV